MRLNFPPFSFVLDGLAAAETPRVEPGLAAPEAEAAAQVWGFGPTRRSGLSQAPVPRLGHYFHGLA